MAKIINFQVYRLELIAGKGFEPWERRFGEKYDAKTTSRDLSNQTLLRLASPGDESTIAFYDMILGILDLGSGDQFYYLENSDQLNVLQIHLFLADNLRFELMRRLGWLDYAPWKGMTLLKMVQDFNQLKTKAQEQSPILSKSHPDYIIYTTLVGGDRDAFIRLMLPDALAAFKKRIKA